MQADLGVAFLYLPAFFQVTKKFHIVIDSDVRNIEFHNIYESE